MKILEAVVSNNDSWDVTFYYVLVLILLISFFVAYLQVFVKPLKKKKTLKENIIYQNTEDIMEQEDIEDELKKKKKSQKQNKKNNSKKTNKNQTKTKNKKNTKK